MRFLKHVYRTISAQKLLKQIINAKTHRGIYSIKYLTKGHEPSNSNERAAAAAGEVLSDIRLCIKLFLATS